MTAQLFDHIRRFDGGAVGMVLQNHLLPTSSVWAERCDGTFIAALEAPGI